MNNNQLIEIKQAANDAWLGIFAKEHTLFNPLENIPPVYRNDTHLYFTYLMSRPEYFSFICKELLNITIYPFQSVILNEVWNHQFPMLVASRGASKCLHYDTLILTNKGIKKIGDVINSEGKVYFGDLKVYSESGWQKVEYGWCNGVKDTVIIELKNGLEIECTLNHPLRKGIKDKSVWCNAEDLKVGDCIKLLAPDFFNETSSYTEDYAFSLSTMFESQTEFPESVYSFSKETLRIYVESLGVVNKKFRKISHFSKKMIKELQVLAFWATGKKTKSTYSEGTYHLYIYDDQAKYSSIESIKPSRTKTYDLHLYEDHSFLSNGMVSHNSYTLALYALLRAILLPGRKIIIVGSVFRQSKVIFNYLTKMYQNAPLLRDSNPGKGPKMYPDRCELQIGDSLITALPIGAGGDSIRGYRSNDTLADEFSCVTGNTLVNTELGILKIQDFPKFGWPKVVNMRGELETPSRFIVTPPDDVYKIKTEYGYELHCSPRHKYMLECGEWKLGKDLNKGDRIIVDSNRVFSEKYVEDSGNILNERLGWLMGILVSEGTVTNRNYVTIKNTDKNLIDKIKEIFNDFEWKETYKEACKDKRGWNCKESWDLAYYNTGLRSSMEKFGMKYSIAIEKTIPEAILRSPKSVILSFLSGLYEGDGSAFHNSCGNENRVDFRVVYYTSSYKLIKVLHFILLTLGIYSNINTRKAKDNSKESYILVTRNQYAKKLFEMLDVVKWKNVLPGEIPIKRSGSIKESKGKFYASTSIDNKNKHIGTFNSYEEAQQGFDDFINNRPETVKVVSVEKLPEKEVLYDFEMPETHSFIGNGFINHNSQSAEIFETVIAGFSSVAQDPVKNTQEAAALAFLKSINQSTEIIKRDEFNKDNQIVLTGSAYYYFNHFAQYWEKWRSIIYSRGSEEKLNEIFKGEIPLGFNWEDYCIMRLPYQLLPVGFMSDANIARSKATMSSSIFSIEFEATFSKDSNGFFKASSIENATANKDNNIILPSSAPEPIIFEPKVKGDPGKQYVFGVDPASEVDNFSIVVIEIGSDHNKIVYCWTTNAKKFKRKLQKGLINNKDYYGFTCRKIRDLMKDFNCVHLAIDAQGGGKAVYEAFHDDKSIEDGELPLWEIIESDKKKDSDGEAGLHIVQLAQFSNYEYLSSANHNLKKDIEDKTLLFPRYSAALLTFENAMTGIDEEDLEDTSIYDTLEDCIIEVQELKSELAQIVVTNTVSGRERWDTPETKISGSKKGRARKDRYSALLMANAAARKFMRGENNDRDLNLQYTKTQDKTLSFIGPKWATDPLSELYND